MSSPNAFKSAERTYRFPGERFWAHALHRDDTSRTVSLPCHRCGADEIEFIGEFAPRRPGQMHRGTYLYWCLFCGHTQFVHGARENVRRLADAYAVVSA